MSSTQWSRLGALVAIVQLIAACAGSAVGTSTSTPTATAPVITIQPTSQAVTAEQPATFTVAALGTTPLLYQWNRNGSAIPGATAASYTITATSATDNGATFSATVTNAAGAVTSNNAVLTMPGPLYGIYANSTILLASNYGIAPGNSATVNDTGFAALHTAMIASPGTIWHVIFSPGAYTYTNNRWLWDIQNVIIDAYGASFQCTSTDPYFVNGIPLNTGDYFTNSGDVPAPYTYTTGYLINTAASGASSVTTITAADAGNFTVGMPVVIYGYDQQGSGYPPNMRYFEYKTVLTANAGTGVVTFTDQLQNFYDSRWWDTTYPDGDHLAHGAPRILPLQRADYNQPNLIWLKGGSFLPNSNNSAFNLVQTSANLVIYEDVSATAFNVIETNKIIIERSNFAGDQSTCDKLVDSMLLENSSINPNPGYPAGALTDCAGTNKVFLSHSKFYGALYQIGPRHLMLNDVDVIPASTSYSGIGTAVSFPISSASIGNTRIYNTGQAYGFTNVASPGNALTVGSVSGTNIQMTWNSTSQAIAYRIEYGMTLTNTTTGNTGVITGIYLSGGNLVITGTWGTPSPGDVMYYYDVINKYDQGGNVIVGTQVPFWRVPPSLAP